MGNQLFVCCLKGSLLVTFREFRFKVLAIHTKYQVLIINVYLHVDDFKQVMFIIRIVSLI